MKGVIKLSENNDFQKDFVNDTAEEEKTSTENNTTETKKTPTKRTRLSNPKEIRRYMSSLIRRVEAGTLDLATARTLINIAGELLKAYRTDVLEQQLIDLSRQLESEAEALNDFDDNNYFIKPVN